MTDIPDVRYTLIINDRPAEFFRVFEVRGRDALSCPYEFVITAATADNRIDPASMLRQRATLRILGERGENAWSGLVFAFDYLRTHDEHLFFRIVLAPRLKRLSLTRHNQIFLDKSLPEILDAVFTECALTDYELRLQGSYDPLEYVCQYNESSLQFVSRLMEHNGLYYFFEETGHGEKCIVTDTRLAHMPIPEPELLYLPVSGLDEPEQERKITELVCERRIVPAKILLRDYNYQLPDVDISASADVAGDGEGVHYHYGDHFATVEEGQRLANIRAQELLAAQEVFSGAGTAPLLRAGKTFRLRRHPLDACNREYLVTEVEHTGRDRYFPLAAPETRDTDTEPDRYYRNRFKAIAAIRQYRPPRVTEKPRIHGMLHAVVDAVGDGSYAMLDASGRYKIRMPFDLAGRPDGYASHWVRMAGPYAGTNFGMHFPLLKGTEVMLAFIDGDPDRPFITSAVHNAGAPDMIKGANSALNAIKTAGNNQIVLGDVKGQEFIGLSSPFHSSSIMLGSTKPGGGGSLEFKTAGDSESFVLGCENSAIVGTSNSAVLGAKTGLNIAMSTEIFAGMKADCTLGPHFDMKYGSGLEMGTESESLFDSKAVTGTDKVELCAGMDDTLKALLKKIYAVFIVAGVGTALASASATVMSESFSKDGVLNEDISDKGHKASILAGSAGVVASSTLVTALMAYAYHLLKKVQEKSEEAYTSRLDITKTGVSMTVNGYRGDPVTNQKLSMPINIQASRQTLPTEVNYTSFLRMLNDGQNLCLVNKRSGQANATDGIDLSFTDGTKATLTVPGAGMLVFDQTKAKQPVVLVHVSRAGLQIDTDGATLCSPNQTNKVMVQNATCGLCTGDNTKVTLDGNNVTIAFAQRFTAGSLAVDNTGKITLGGPVEGQTASFTGEVDADYFNETRPDEGPILVDPNYGKT